MLDTAAGEVGGQDIGIFPSSTYKINAAQAGHQSETPLSIICAKVWAPPSSCFHFSLARLERPQQLCQMPWTRLLLPLVGRCRRKRRFPSDSTATGIVISLWYGRQRPWNLHTSRTVSWKRWGREHSWFNYHPLTSLLTPFWAEQLHSLFLTAIDLQTQTEVAASIALSQHVNNILCNFSR